EREPYDPIIRSRRSTYPAVSIKTPHIPARINIKVPSKNNGLKCEPIQGHPSQVRTTPTAKAGPNGHPSLTFEANLDSPSNHPGTTPTKKATSTSRQPTKLPAIIIRSASPRPRALPPTRPNQDHQPPQKPRGVSATSGSSGSMYSAPRPKPKRKRIARKI